MRFATRFTRWKGGGAPAGAKLLGADVVPTDVPGSPGLDNQATTRVHGYKGFPVRRVGVAYKAPSGVVALTATLYVYVPSMTAWLRIGAAAQPLEAGAITMIDLPVVADWITGSEAAAVPAVAMTVLVGDPGTAPAGAHEFALAAML